MKLRLLLLFGMLLGCAVVSQAQVSFPYVLPFTSDPTGLACGPAQLAVNTNTDIVYCCDNSSQFTACSVSGGGPPSGSAGGDLSGSYPNPTVAKINGGSVPASAKILGTNGSSQPIAAALTSAHVYVGNGSNLPADVAISQDSTLSNAGVMTNTGLQGNSVPSGTPANGQLLIGNGTNWSKAVLTAGANVTITNGSGTITIASSGSGGSTAWSGIGNPSGNLTLTMGTNNSTFNYSAGTPFFQWANTTAAVMGTNQSSPFTEWCGTYWTGSASAADCWSMQLDETDAIGGIVFTAGGTSPSFYTNQFGLTLPSSANTVQIYANETIYPGAGSVNTGTYTSGGSITGSATQTCNLTFINCTGATGTVALTGSNVIAPGTALTITAAGVCTQNPNSATLSNGTATCSGTAVVATTENGFLAGQSAYMAQEGTQGSGSFTLDQFFADRASHGWLVVENNSAFHRLIEGPNSASTAGVVPMFANTGGRLMAASSITDNGTTVATTEALNAGSLSSGSTPPTACSPATGCVALAEAATAGTPTSGVDYIRADSATHKLLCSQNGGAETACVGSSASYPAITSTQSTINITGSGTGTVTLDLAGAVGKIMAGSTPALTYTPTLGVAGSNAGTLTLASGSNAASVTLSSGSTSNWTFKFPSTGGTNTYLLQTDGSGNTSWVAPGAGGVTTTGSTAQYQTSVFSAAGTITGVSPGTSGQCLTSNGSSSYPTYQTCGVGAGVTSFSGDGTIITNSLSTGAVTTSIAGTSGGIPYGTSASAWAFSALLPAKSFMYGGGAGAAPAGISLSTGYNNGGAPSTDPQIPTSVSGSAPTAMRLMAGGLSPLLSNPKLKHLCISGLAATTYVTLLDADTSTGLCTAANGYTAYSAPSNRYLFLITAQPYSTSAGTINYYALDGSSNKYFIRNGSAIQNAVHALNSTYAALLPGWGMQVYISAGTGNVNVTAIEADSTSALSPFWVSSAGFVSGTPLTVYTNTSAQHAVLGGQADYLSGFNCANNTGNAVTISDVWAVPSGGSTGAGDLITSAFSLANAGIYSSIATTLNIGDTLQVQVANTSSPQTFSCNGVAVTDTGTHP